MPWGAVDDPPPLPLPSPLSPYLFKLPPLIPLRLLEQRYAPSLAHHPPPPKFSDARFSGYWDPKHQSAPTLAMDVRDLFLLPVM